MYQRMIGVTLFTIVVATGSAFGEDCANEASAVSIADCHTARYIAADKAMNAVYNTAMKSLSEDEKTKFRDAQRAWLKYRDASFSLIIELNKDARSYGRIVVAEYKAKLVEKRVLEMKYILAGPESPPVVW
jgi:uncharacterized protein YecT (DUF1311 family)